MLFRSQIREDYNSRFLTQDSEELVLEKSVIPGIKEMPALIVFRRVSFRQFPKGQTVALYYSSLMDKYLSIPVGGDKSVNLSEDLIDYLPVPTYVKTAVKTLGSISGTQKPEQEKSSDDTKTQKNIQVPKPKTYSSWEKRPKSHPVKDEKTRQAELAYMKKANKLPPTQRVVKENRITDLRRMIEEGIDSKDLYINGRSVTLNTSMAKRILEVYDSVNTKNKKIVESMLNEDLESFKKLLNFSIKQ